MGRSNYDVVVYRWTENEEMSEAKRFNSGSLGQAQVDFKYQLNNLRWSLAHRLSLGISKDEDIIIELFDNREGFALEQRGIIH